MQIRPIPTNGSPAFRIFHDEEDLGSIETYENPFHEGNCYLKLSLSRLESSAAKPLFADLREHLGKPLQVMLSSGEGELAEFLKTGGFRRARRCYETEAGREQLLPGKLQQVKTYETGSPEYEAACRLLYAHYARTHEAVNPLTADFETFRQELPTTVFCQYSRGEAVHAAFVEENEVAYVCTEDMDDFPSFLRSVAQAVFAQHETVLFESDDTDPAAMALRDLFQTEDDGSFDTYIRK